MLPTTATSTLGQELLGFDTVGILQGCSALTCAAFPSSLLSLQAPLCVQNPSELLTTATSWHSTWELALNLRIPLENFIYYCFSQFSSHRLHVPNLFPSSGT